jgi:parallel beta-helix repeat protein
MPLAGIVSWVQPAEAAQAPAGVAGCDQSPVMPSPPAGAKVVSRDGTSDDTSAIQSAINGLHPGDWLVFPPGTYSISKHLTVPANGVTLYGKGATIHSINQADGAIMIEGDNTAVYGFTLTQDSTGRQTTPWAGGISLWDGRVQGKRRIQGLVLQGNTINNTTGGIFLNKVTNFTVADNTIYRSRADGIHMTGGTMNGRVINNSVSQNGDDMIAVVSYAGAKSSAPAEQRYQNWTTLLDGLDTNIYIAGNKVSDQFWGRGITVVGGSNVTIDRNSISRTPIGAAIYLTREKSYMTFGDHNVLVIDNTISDVQTQQPTFKPDYITLQQTHQGAIELGAQVLDDEVGNATYREAFSVGDIGIIGNTVRASHYSGIRIGAFSAPNSIHHVIVQGNDLANVTSKNIADIQPGMDASSLACSNNTLDGKAWASQCNPSTSAVSANFTVTGASLVCMSDGTVRAK